MVKEGSNRECVFDGAVLLFDEECGMDKVCVRDRRRREGVLPAVLVIVCVCHVRVSVGRVLVRESSADTDGSVRVCVRADRVSLGVLVP